MCLAGETTITAGRTAVDCGSLLPAQYSQSLPHWAFWRSALHKQCGFVAAPDDPPLRQIRGWVRREARTHRKGQSGGLDGVSRTINPSYCLLPVARGAMSQTRLLNLPCGTK